MPRPLTLDEDIALKRLVTTPRSQKPDYSWREAITNNPNIRTISNCMFQFCKKL